MSQLYVPEGTFLVCSEGMKKNQLKGGSQTSIYISGGKLATTINDRFSGNFICGKMMLAGAIAGAIVAAVVVVAGTVLSGGLAGVAVTTVVASAMSTGATYAVGGALVGATGSFIPSVCSLLCISSKWYPVHDKVLLQNQPALLETSQITCSFGGHIMIFYSEKAADEFVNLARSNAIIKIGNTILGSALLSAAIAGILSGVASLFKNTFYIGEEFSWGRAGIYFVENSLNSTLSFTIGKYMGEFYKNEKERSYREIQDYSGFRIYDYSKNSIVEEADIKLGNSPVIKEEMEINNIREILEENVVELEPEELVIRPYEDRITQNVNVLNTTPYRNSELVEPAQYSTTRRDINTIPSRNSTISQRYNYNSIRSDYRGVFYDADLEITMRGQELQINSFTQMFDNSIKSILNGLIPADINDVLQEVYTILSNMLLEGDIKNLEEAT